MKQRIADIIRVRQIRTELAPNPAVLLNQTVRILCPLLATRAINTEEAIKCHENRRSPLSVMSRARPRIHLSQCPYEVLEGLTVGWVFCQTRHLLPQHLKAIRHILSRLADIAKTIKMTDRQILVQH